METVFAFETKRTRPQVIQGLLYAPDDIRPDEKLPLIVWLHGAGERGDDPSILRNCPPARRFDPSRLRALLLCPQCRENDVWDSQVHELNELIEHTVFTQPVDSDRVSLTGFSMGGFGTWALAMAYPARFSALAPLCGGGMAWNVGGLASLPLRVYHGDNDTEVAPICSLQMVQAVNRSGGHATLTLLPGVGHDCWTYAYEQTDLLVWLTEQTRKG